MMQERPIPGISLAVRKDGRTLVSMGYGVADLGWSPLADEDSSYQIASVTKQFTATAVMMPVEKGKLSLDGKIGQYLMKPQKILFSDVSQLTVKHFEYGHGAPCPYFTKIEVT